MFDEKSYNIKMDKAIEVFTKELSSLRTGRANASMLDLVKVDVYGQQMPIKRVMAENSRRVVLSVARLASRNHLRGCKYAIN